MSLKSKLIMLMAFVFIIPLFWTMNPSVAAAATSPSLVQSKVDIVGTGETFQLAVKDKVAKSKYKWTSSNTEVATVTSKGLVTSVGKGTVTIKCKITYPSKKTKTLSCKVTVTIPADAITIINTTLENGAYKMNLGDTMDFDYELMPIESTDKVYWSIGVGDKDCIRIDNASEGRITAMKTGKVTLQATAASASTQEAADKSFVNDAVIIEVVGPTATVKSAEITSGNVIKVVFDSAINPTTVIGDKSKLTDNVSISLGKDTKGVTADDPGTMTASISSDNKTLTITSQNAFNGYYGISITDGVLTSSGLALESYYKKLYFIDTTPPTYTVTTLDDTGYIATINFSEALNFANLKVNGAAVVSTTGSSASSGTLSTLNNVLNYTVSNDKKSMTINLSKIAAADYGKIFSVFISGVTDLAGNTPANSYMTAYLQIDTSAKPQATILSVVRSTYNTLTVTFDRAIKYAGFLQIASGATINGTIDTTDSKKVNYTITDAECLYTGVKQVSVGYWNSYNVATTDTSANSMHNFYVDFTADSTSPVLLSVDYDSDKSILTLTYSEDVTLTVTSGIFTSTFTTVTEDIIPNTNISYSRITHTEGNRVIKLQLTGASTIGSYSFALDQGFVTDSFRNKSVGRAMVITAVSSTSSELPGPYSIAQNPANLSQIYVRFIYKLDKVSAETISNYSIAGLTITSASVTENSPTSSTVVLTVADGAIVAEVARPVSITGIKGYNNSYTAITSYNTNVTLKENARPSLLSQVFDTTSKKAVKLNFSEVIKGNLAVKVTQIIGTSSIEIANTVTITDNTALITLNQMPATGSWLKIDILTNTITDTNGNSVSAMQSTYMVSAVY